MRLTTAQTAALLWLAERNGEGVLDKYGRVCAGGSSRAVGSWLAWLNLVAAGFVAGSRGRLYLTADGRAAVDRARTAATPRAETKTIEQTYKPVPRTPNLDEIDRTADEGERYDEWKSRVEDLP